MLYIVIQNDKVIWKFEKEVKEIIKNIIKEIL